MTEATRIVEPTFMKALLTLDAYVVVSGGSDLFRQDRFAKINVPSSFSYGDLVEDVEDNVLQPMRMAAFYYLRRDVLLRGSCRPTS
ncbi:hypothetical protein ABZY81_16625 [Streptomyces sp. NPDC006514]|uniref:hypothetical protein n=1 Tax=Streptomyces sp. NPDC006514 TaxID=3154308 RepID=UPI0033AE1569